MLQGMVLGLITFIGFLVIWIKAPAFIRKQGDKHPFLIDLFISAGTYFLLGGISGSFSAVLGAGVAGILFSIYLWLSHNYSLNL